MDCMAIFEEKEVIDLGGKVKFPRCEVIFTGERKAATDILVKKYPDAAVIEAMVTVGDHQTATVSNYGTATAGNYGTATAANCGTANAGNFGTARAGYGGMVKAGENGRISLLYQDGIRYREMIGYVGEDGIVLNVTYKLVAGKFVKA